MSSYPYVPNSTVFNTNDYNILNEGLTIETANKLYLSINDGRYITGITEGVAQPSKALVLNSALNIAGINDISSSFIETKNTSSTSITPTSIGSDYGLHLHSVLASNNGIYSGSSIAFNNSSIDNIPLGAIVLDKISSSVGNLVFSTKNGSNCDERFRITNDGIQTPGILDFHLNSLLYKAVIRPSTITLSDGIEIYDTQFSTNSVPNLNFRNDNNSAPIFMEMCGYLNNSRTTMTANGQPFRIMYKDGSAFTSGLNITCMNTSQASNVNYNIVLSARNATIPHVVVNDRANQLHLFPQGLAELNTTYAQNVIVGEEMLVRKTLCLGTSQDTSSNRMISALNSGMATASSIFFTLGQGATSRNQAEFSFYYDGNASTLNRLDVGFFGGNLFYFLASGRLGVGTSNPLAGIHCTVGVSTTIASASVYGEYGSTSSSSNNLGPITRTIGIRSTDSFLTNGSFFAQSDRRVKKDISPVSIDEALDFVNNVTPVKYRLINEDNTKPLHNGYIAQDLKNHIDLLNFSEVDNLPAINTEDIENVMLSVDYAKVSVLLHKVLKNTIERVEALEARLKKNK